MVERDSMEFDVVIVGAGPAGLACAIHLADLCARHNEAAETPLEPEVVVLEKGKEVGAHIYSGAVLDPRGLDELIPDFRAKGAPIEAEVSSDSVFMFKEGGARKLPLTPPSLRNAGNCVVSLNRLVRWLGAQAEERGVTVFEGIPGRELVLDGNTLRGVQLADAGVGKDGQQKGNFEAGGLALGRVTVLAEGSRGSLTKDLVSKLGLAGQNPQVYATGVKEVWEVPEERFAAGAVLHSMGWPHPAETYGGGWVYGMGEGPEGGRLVSVGCVTGLENKDPTTDPHRYFQLYKTHPKIRAILQGGKMLDYGAKSLPEGGLFSMPTCHGEGFLLIGDAGGFMNPMRLKGIHLAFRSGMLAARTIFDALRSRAEGGVLSASTLASFTRAFESDWSHAELRKSRNFHQGFEGGRLRGLLNAVFVNLFGGRGFLWRDNLKCSAGHEHYAKLDGRMPARPAKLPDEGTLTFDKVTDVYASGTKHEEDQPCHLVITEPDLCNTRCREEYGNPCQYFCPAEVYEMVAPSEGAATELKLNPSNCVHCKTCDIADPYQVIDWVTPEGGGGPGYRLL